MAIHFIEKIFNIEIEQESVHSPYDLKRIQLIYKISLLNALLSLLITIILTLFFHDKSAFFYGIGIVILFLIPIFFTFQKLYFASKVAFEVVLVLAAIGLAILFGKPSLAEFMVLFIPVRALIFFKEVKPLVVLLFSFITLIVIEYIYLYIPSIITIKTPLILTICMGGVIIVVVYALVSIFKSEILEVNELVFEKNQDLEKMQQIVERQNQKLLESNQKLNVLNLELQQFASMASHDMREPLRTISNFGTLLAKRTKEDERSTEFLNFIVGAAKRMSGLLDDLISYARAGVPKDEVKAVDLNKVVAIAAQNLYRLAEESQGTIQPENLPKLEGHQTLFLQLLQNIISNGLKFHRTDVPSVIKISATTNNTHVIIYIEDNGIGIENQFLQRVFEPFTRLHAVGTFEGSGIGLATCKKIMDFYQGKIEVKSTFNEGTTFELWFPKTMLKEI